MDKLAYTPKEAAKVLRVGVNRIYQLCRMDGLPIMELRRDVGTVAYLPRSLSPAHHTPHYENISQK